ncbi:hypothetical protein FOZ62_007978, partial [Perkinsus olseni]
VWSRDLEQWWPVLATGGLIAGSTFVDDDQHPRQLWWRGWGRRRRFTAALGSTCSMTFHTFALLLGSIGVATAVREFANTVQADLYLTQDSLPSWYMWSINMDLSSSSSSFPPRPASAHSRGAACHTSFHAQAMRESAEAVPRWEAPQRLAHRYARLRTSTSSSIRSTGLDRTDRTFSQSFYVPTLAKSSYGE